MNARMLIKIRKSKKSKGATNFPSLFLKSLGPILDTIWHVDNCHVSTPEAVVCQICGRRFPELEDDENNYHVASFLGRQVVLECCGRIFNYGYNELGMVFTYAKLQEFSENPTGFPFLLDDIKRNVSKALGKMREMSSVAQEVMDIASG